MTVFLGQRVYLLHLHYCRKQPCIFDGFLLIGFVACLLFYEVGLEFLRTSHQSAAVKAGIPAIPQRPWNTKKGWIFQLRNLPLPLFLDGLRHVLGEGVTQHVYYPWTQSHQEVWIEHLQKTPRNTTWCHGSLNISDCKATNLPAFLTVDVIKQPSSCWICRTAQFCQSLGLESGRKLLQFSCEKEWVS